MSKSLNNHEKISNQGQMTPGEFAQVMGFLGWSQHFLARELSCTSTLVWRWSIGDLRIPPEPAAYLRTMARAKERIHVPRGWQARPGVKAASPGTSNPTPPQSSVKLNPVSTAPAIPVAPRSLARSRDEAARARLQASRPRQTL